MASLPISLTNLLDEELTDSVSRDDALEENDNPPHRYQCNAQESVFIPDIPVPEEICIAPGEGKIPNSIITDESCEVLVTYMCAYFSTAENETSEAMQQASKEAGMSGKTELEKMRAVAKAYYKKKRVLGSRGSVPTNARIVVQENIS